MCLFPGDFFLKERSQNSCSFFIICSRVVPYSLQSFFWVFSFPIPSTQSICSRWLPCSVGFQFKGLSSRKYSFSPVQPKKEPLRTFRAQLEEACSQSPVVTFMLQNQVHKGKQVQGLYLMLHQEHHTVQKGEGLVINQHM